MSPDPLNEGDVLWVAIRALGVIVTILTAVIACWMIADAARGDK